MIGGALWLMAPGLSPRARGKRVGRPVVCPTCGSIPAGAGEALHI